MSEGTNDRPDGDRRDLTTGPKWDVLPGGLLPATTISPPFSMHFPSHTTLLERVTTCVIYSLEHSGLQMARAANLANLASEGQE